MVRNIGDRKKDRKHDSVSLSPAKGINGERPTSSYGKSKEIPLKFNDSNEKQQLTNEKKKNLCESKYIRDTNSEK